MPSFLNELAKAQPVPGGGAAAAQVSLTALALLTKVLALETGRPGLVREQREEWRRLALRARDLQKELQRLRGRDGQAYLDWIDHRGRAGEGDFVRLMVETPMQIVSRSLEVLELVPRAGLQAKKHLRPDLLASAELLQGGALAAARIAFGNLPLIKDGELRRGLAEGLVGQTVRIGKLVRKAGKILKEGR